MHNRPGGEKFRDAFDDARSKVELGEAEFPLSAGHYVETWRHADPQRRLRLAQTMIELSRGRTMARPPDLCDNELDAEIARLAESDLPREPWPVFGWGFPHASGLSRSFARELLDLDYEITHLATRPDGFDAHGSGHREFGDLYRDGERGLAAGRREGPQGRSMDEAILAASSIMEIWENIEWAIQRADLPREALGPVGLTRPDLPDEQVQAVLNELLPIARGFIGQLPTRDAALRIRSERHRNPNSTWESNDMIDIGYLADAVVHCDVIVTERQWVHELRQAGLDELHGTTLIHNVSKLPELLAES